MMKSFLVLGLLFCSVGLFAQNERILAANHSFSKQGGVERAFYTPTYYKGNPMLKADKKQELGAADDPYAAPPSGGVWYGEIKDKYKMWYSVGGGKKYGLIIYYAVSDDGKYWVRPELDVVPGTNVVGTTEHDCVSVLPDKFERDAVKRCRIFVVEFNTGASVSMQLEYSADGIHWSGPKAFSGELYDRCVTYYDPFRGKYVLSSKTINGKKYRRSRCFLVYENPEILVSLVHRVYDSKSDKFIKYWSNAEDNDPRHPGFPETRPQIRNHKATPYRSSLIGYFTVQQGPEDDAYDCLNIQKQSEVLIGWSDDGFHWNCEFKQPSFPVSDDAKAQNAGNVQSTADNPLIVGGSLHFYVGGRYDSKPMHDLNFTIGPAALHHDDLVSMQAGTEEGHPITGAVTVNGNYLSVNVDVHRKKRKSLVEVLDTEGTLISGFTKKDCSILKQMDSTEQMTIWRDKMDLPELSGRNISLKFYLTSGDLYPFWIPSWKTGEGGDCTAEGGPGLNPVGVDIK